MLNSFLTPQFLTFLLTGGFAAAVNFFSRIVYNFWLSYSWSVIVAYFTGMITAFILARIFVFKTTTRSFGQSALWFGLVNVVAILQTWGISVGLAFHVLPTLGVVNFSKEIAHAVGVVFPVFTSYLGHKYFSFR